METVQEILVCQKSGWNQLTNANFEQTFDIFPSTFAYLFNAFSNSNSKARDKHSHTIKQIVSQYLFIFSFLCLGIKFSRIELT